MAKIRLAAFDLEGTLFQQSYALYDGQHFHSAWQAICSALGPEAEREDAINRERFYAGGYPGYSQWVADTIGIHQKYDLRREHFEEIINSVAYHAGVAETMTALKKRGITIATVSGGLKALADRATLDHRLQHCFASAEYFWNADGTLRHWNIMPTDFAHKRSVVEMLLKDLGMTPDECAFVGDGRNDVDVARYVGRAIAFNPHQALRDCCEIVIEQPKGQEDLSVVLQHLLADD